MLNATYLIVAGIIALIGGAVALIFPLPASLAVTVFVGWVLIVISALGLFAVFSEKTLPLRGWAAFFSFVELVAGVWILANPMAGMISLTVMVGALFFASGITRIIVSFAYRSFGSWFWLMILSGAVSAGLGLYVLFSLPEASLVLLGVLVAIELLFIGSTLLSLGISLRRIKRL